jgi:hypothetical protein
MKAIPLTRGLVTLVDDDDYEWISQWKWYASVVKGERKFYATTDLDGRSIKMHRIILGLQPRDGVEVDHRDGDSLNNQRHNLRQATHSQNMANIGLRKTNKSGYKGVHWNKRAGKWMSQIRKKGTRIHLGTFTDAEEAARAYDAKAKELHGDFAYLNFPTKKTSPPYL